MPHKKIIDYKIITTDRDDCRFIDFEEKILKEIKEGWQPIGGVCLLHTTEIIEFKPFQAMIKYEKG